MDLTLSLEHSYTQEIVVGAADSAKSLGSGGLDVYGTPAMIAHMEHTALTLLRKFLPEGADTVGTAIAVKHVKASPIGMKITLTALVTAVSGRQADFEITARDSFGDVIGTAQHTRFSVDIAKFMQKTNAQLLA